MFIRFIGCLTGSLCLTEKKAEIIWAPVECKDMGDWVYRGRNEFVT